MKRHPIQPLQEDEKGVLRFKENSIVRYVLDNGGVNLNHLACLEFPREDREQFAQLIGYSLSGYADLSYVTNETYAAAQSLNENLEVSALEARIGHLEGLLSELREGLRAPLAGLYECHPDDFGFKG